MQNTRKNGENAQAGTWLELATLMANPSPGSKEIVMTHHGNSQVHQEGLVKRAYTILRGPSRPDLLRDECLADILTATARNRPQHPALIWGKRIVTYGELTSAGNVIGGALAQRGAAAGQVVGLWMPRGADLLIAQAGIAMNGSAWLPFDAETPLKRIQACLESAKACGLVTCRQWLPGPKDLPTPSWSVEDLLAVNTRLPDRAKPSDAAYVIYTSGSTGLPKGIVITNRSICHFLRGENEILGVCEHDQVYQGFSIAFDMSFEEIWISYLVGATLWIAPPDLVGDPNSLAEAVAQHRLTVMHAVPTLMGLIDAPLPTVRLINLGGEACPEALVPRLARPGRQVFNTYGPTETTVSASIAELTPGRPVTIGVPLPNCGMMIVDEQHGPLPAGEVGELCIFGPGLAHGYLNQPDLTADRFIRNPFAETPDEELLYLTGDLAFFEDAAGPVHCLGRTDNQVKIRGFRVELGEIEAVLLEQPGVAAAAVVVRPMAEVEQLVGFIVASGNQAPEPEALRIGIESRLPPYMTPAHFEIVLQLPRLTSGKLDRKALSNLPLSMAAPEISAAPADEHEAALFAALGKLFPGRGLRSDADFFDELGGHSLLAARLVSMLRAERQYAGLSVGDIYRERRLASIAAAMRREQIRTSATAAPPRAPTPWLRRTLCGLAQAAAVPGLVLINIGSWLAPFFVYHYFTGDEGDSIPLAAFYSLLVFLLMEGFSFGIAIGGKRLVANRLQPGRYPLWGVTYFRWWLGSRICDLAPVYLLAGTPLLNWYLQLLGARIGRDVLIDSVSLPVPELLTIGDGVSVGTAVCIENAQIQGGELVIGPVHLGRDAVVDSYAVLEPGASLGTGARLSGLSALASGRHVPDGETWEGSPAARIERTAEAFPPRPPVGRMQRAAQTAFFALACPAVATLFFMPVFPSFILIDFLDMNTWNLFENEPHPHHAFGLFFLLAIPASALLVAITILLTAGLRRLFLPRQTAGVFSVYGVAYCRKWLLSRVLDNSLGVLHSLYATVYAPVWLRMMGARVGRGTEVSTASGLLPDLLQLGEDNFIADAAMLGDEEQRGGWMALRETSIGNRSFIGNGAYVSDGAVLPDDVLIGVQTRTPDNDKLKPGQTWMGSPALLLPAREYIGGFDERLTFRPSRSRRFSRGSVELLRIVLPLAFVIASGYLIVQRVMPIAEREEWFSLAMALALAGCLYGLASFLVVLCLKWILVGRYKPRAAPMWTLFVWLSEGVTNLYESLAVPNFLGFLRGSPLLPWALRLFGARIGKGVYLDTTDMTEFDCVRIGDDAEMNAWSGPQTHLFEDRVMKIGKVDIGARSTIGSCSTILYDAQVGEDVRLGPLTLVAKGERLPAATCWEGSPASPMQAK